MFDPKAHLIHLPRRVKDPGTGHWTTRLDDYLEVKWRLVWFREKCPHGRLATEALVLDWDKGVAIYKATVEDGDGGTATGTGTETRQGFADFVEKAETRAIGRALAALGIGTQFVGEELSEGEHIVDAPVARGNGSLPQTCGGDDGQAVPPETFTPAQVNSQGRLPPEARLTPDQARDLKKAAQAAFGYREGERRLRAALGFEVDEALTLRHLAAHVSADTYATLRTRYEAALRQQVEADVPG